MTVLGFVLLFAGMLSTILLIVGANFQFLAWIDAFGRGIGALLRLILIILGFLLIFFARVDCSQERIQQE